MEIRQNEAVWQEKYCRWVIKVQRNGARKAFYSSKEGKKGKLEAERKADAWIEKGSRKELRVGELCRIYLDGIDTGHSLAHLKKETSVVKTWILPFWEHRKVSSLTNLDYKEAIFRPAECSPPKSKRTCGHVRSVISALYTTARMAKVDMEPPFKLPLPKAATTKEKRVLSAEEFSRLLTEGSQYWHVHAFRFIAVLGLRRGELCGLLRSDLDGNKLTISRSIDDNGQMTTGKTAAAQRTIILPTIALQILSEQNKMLEAAGVNSLWLFPSKKGGATNPHTLLTRWKYFCSKINLPPLSLHELRHTMISTLKNDMDLPSLKAVVGHTPKMDTLRVYGHDTGTDAERAAEKINAAYNKILKLG